MPGWYTSGLLSLWYMCSGLYGHWFGKMGLQWAKSEEIANLIQLFYLLTYSFKKYVLRNFYVETDGGGTILWFHYCWIVHLKIANHRVSEDDRVGEPWAHLHAWGYTKTETI